MGGVRRFDRTQSSVLLTHSASILSCNSIILLYSDIFLFCILRNPNLQGIDFFFFLELIWEFVIDFFLCLDLEICY